MRHWISKLGKGIALHARRIATLLLAGLVTNNPVFGLIGFANAMYHIAGVRAFALPNFPGPYAGGIPCCAATTEETLEVRVLELG